LRYSRFYLIAVRSNGEGPAPVPKGPPLKGGQFGKAEIIPSRLLKNPMGDGVVRI
jgi:hypothetical protein